MGIRPMPWDTWLELDSDYQKTLDIVSRRTRTQGEEANRVMPDFRPQAFECLVEMASYLAIRYPRYFTVKRVKYDEQDESSWGDLLSGKEAGCVRVIENKITEDVFDFAEIERVEGKEWNPMRVAASQVSIERFFQKLNCGKPVQRYNYTFRIDDQVAWSNHTNGPEQIFDEATKGPDPELLAQLNGPNWKAPQPATA
ncbi:hypothetical protein MVLG_00875 [Microbotryum lychnidis-dioicae p1A1 Lamole]|uniref:Uncharacterized protein n=1 Tax=Microbotryum lychnidis-dioicae (strain p1A1 Lamole / MvSl-1064) TaxID=683840 RepID=U5H0E0_USTV1|nr:hypothetical protein MVLG_00875 [Microbotryum lychnidis-dioicae p1A1 Lamole]|eukprot:KDE09162.1 hypothetical protein MVLG_00875 [Microbotryum lychnidis-dioicae p1A1 Lamole]